MSKTVTTVHTRNEYNEEALRYAVDLWSPLCEIVGSRPGDYPGESYIDIRFKDPGVLLRVGRAWGTQEDIIRAREEAANV